VCQRVMCQYLQNDEYKLVEHGEGYLRYKESKMINYPNPQKKKIYTNKIRSSQAMSSGWNRKEKYMLEKDNMMRHIKFLSYWIKTMIPPFTFTITQKDTNSRLRGQLIAFYVRIKNKTSIKKTLKEK